MSTQPNNLNKLNETGTRSLEDRRESVDEFDGEDNREGQRRRQIDPTTCERDYSGDEIEFMKALDDYKRTSRRMFPTCSEMLEVLRALGYQKIDLSEERCSQCGR